MYYIYIIQNKINNKVYVGQTKAGINRRWKQHISYLVKGNHHCIYLQNSWNKYGESAFDYQVIWECESKEEADVIEISLIQEYRENNLSYNITGGGEGFTGHHREESKRKISESLINQWAMGKRKPRSEEANKKISESHKGKIASEETKKRMSEAKKGRKHSEESKEKMRQFAIGRKMSVEAKQKMKLAKQSMSEETKKKMSEAHKKIRSI